MDSTNEYHIEFKSTMDVYQPVFYIGSSVSVKDTKKWQVLLYVLYQKPLGIADLIMMKIP